MNHEHSAFQGTPVQPSTGALRPLPLGDVRITGGFWAQRQSVNGSATLDHCLQWLERMGWIRNFTAVAEGHPFTHEGRVFADSEIYKILEALAWESARTGSPWAEDRYRELSATVVGAQQPDGYLNTAFGSPGQPPRYSDLEWGHELYCAGHLIQAAVARLRTAGSDRFVEAALQLADHICETFGPSATEAVCGHPEIEVALAELGRATGDRRYLDQARLFVERRGRGLLDEGEIGSAYFQDDLPVREATVLRGHAVRALYLSAAAVDVSVEFGDDQLLGALRTQWHNTVAARTYLTGGMGSRHEGESYGEDFELPSDRAYSETCAGIGSVMFSWRLLLADGDEKYADLIERTLYNVVATSPDAAGTSFFYVNPLQRAIPGSPASIEEASPRASSSERAPWFEVSCCPTNVARTFASLSGYVATISSTGLQLHQYVTSEIDTFLADGTRVSLSVQTDYPRDGRVSITVNEVQPATPGWQLTLRVPGWAIGTATVTTVLSGAPAEEPVVATSAAFVVPGFLGAGDVVILQLPTEARSTRADPRVDGVRGQVAFQRGPLVLAAESVDLPDSVTPADLRVVDPSSARVDDDGRVWVDVVAETPGDPDWPYAPAVPASSSSVPLRIPLVAYHEWAERGPSTMRVWLPVV